MYTIKNSQNTFYIDNYNEKVHEYVENVWYGHPIIRNDRIIYKRKDYKVVDNILYENSINIYDIYEYSTFFEWYIPDTPIYYRMLNICNYSYKNSSQEGCIPLSPLIKYIFFKLIGSYKDDIDHLMFKRVSKNYKEPQNLSNRSLVDSYTHLNKIKLNIDKNNRTYSIRDIHPSFRGYICIADTPDGKNVGMFRTLAKNAFISDSSFLLEDDIINSIKDQCEEENVNDMLLFYNSDCFGYISKNTLNNYKQNNALSLSFLDYNAPIKVCIITDSAGRYMRWINNKAVFVGEITEYDIKNFDVYDLLCVAGNLIPYVNHNQAARVSFAINMQKQAISEIYSIYENGNSDSTEQWYVPNCEPPIIKAPMTDMFPYNGINLKCKIAFYDKYNIEDSIVISDETAKKFTSYRCGVIKQKYIYLLKTSMDEKYDDDGVIKVGSFVEKGEILSVVYEPSDIGNITKIYSKCKGEIMNIIKSERVLIIKIKELREIQVGDKFTSRYGQKGVVGKIERKEKLYEVFKEDVDIVINPCAIPSRMTIGQLMEMKESGGYCYYQALRHQVIDKSYSVGEAIRNNITYSSVSGKSKGGSLRLGEMEKDCLIAYKAKNILREMFLERSDMKNIYVCSKCEHNIPYSNNAPLKCGICGSNTKEINIPYSTKLASMVLTKNNILICIKK